MGSHNGLTVPELKTSPSLGSYNGMLVRELKSELEKRKLFTVGVRFKLIERLKGDDEFGYNLLTVPELKIKMKEQGLDVSGNKKVLKTRMKSTLLNRGYKFLPTNDLRQLCSERGLWTNPTYAGKKSMVTRLSKADAAKVTTVSSGSSHNPYSGVTSSTSYAQSPSGDSTPVVMTVIGGVIAFMLVLGCISMLDTEEEDSYSSSSSSSSGGSSTPCEQLKDVWCYSYSLDMCVYHDSSSNIVYYQEANWYGC